MRFKVKSENISNKLDPGEVFEAVKISPCGNHNPKVPCKICPGYVQAPWMKYHNCWGFGNVCYLESVPDKVHRIFINLRMLRPIDEEM